MRMRKVLVICAICLVIACALCACDMEGLVGEVLGDRTSAVEGEMDQAVGGVMGGMIGNGAYEIVTNENGEYVIVGEDGTTIVGDYIIVGGAFGSGSTVTLGSVYDQINKYQAADFLPADGVTNYVRITVRDYGDIVIGLQSNYAPETVKNFQLLVESGFYNGLIFHRVIQNFMIQGGGYDVDGNVIPADTIAGEFTDNGFHNELRHVRGVVSMARTNMPNSASSQFFICHQGSPHLNGEYAAFGYVVCGMEVVDAIANVKTNANDKPLTNVVMTSVRFAEVSE